MLDSQKSTIFELGGTWNGDLVDYYSDHLWTYFFGVELSRGGVLPGRTGVPGIKKSDLLAMMKHG